MKAERQVTRCGRLSRLVRLCQTHYVLALLFTSPANNVSTPRVIECISERISGPTKCSPHPLADCIYMLYI